MDYTCHLCGARTGMMGHYLSIVDRTVCDPAERQVIIRQWFERKKLERRQREERENRTMTRKQLQTNMLGRKVVPGGSLLEPVTVENLRGQEYYAEWSDEALERFCDASNKGKAQEKGRIWGSGSSGVIVNVYLDVDNTPCYSIETDTGEVREIYPAFFRLVEN